MIAFLLTALLQESFDFARDVRPLLAKRCQECHGPAKQKGGLRLDVRSEARRGGDTGPALLPNGPLLTRVSSADPDLRMPPKGEGLSPAEIDLLRRWIAAGAPGPRTPPPPGSCPTTGPFSPSDVPPCPGRRRTRSTPS